jgi:hypothetical protein
MQPPAFVPFRRSLQAHPVASGAFFCFLAVSLIEVVRLLSVGPGAVGFEAGLYDWEPSTAGAQAPMFRWTGADAFLVRPIEADVLGVALYVSRPDIEEGVPIALSVDGKPLAAIEATGNGWIEHLYYIPPLTGMTAELAGGTGAPPLDGWKELAPWRRSPLATMRLGVHAGSTFVPWELGVGEDRRRLGVGLGEMTWHRQVPAGGLGFHPWETDPRGVRFRWTARLWASQPVEVEGAVATFEIRVDHADLAAQPAEVEVYWNERRVHGATLARTAWAIVTLDAAELGSGRGTLSFKVDRTWNPFRAGVSSDDRELGVAVSEVVWR